MSWDDRRTAGAVGTIVRQTAHSDDAKHRPDERTHVRARARWLVPAVVGAVVVVAGGATAAVVTTHGGGPGAAGSPGHGSSTSTSTASKAKSGLAADGTLQGKLTVSGVSQGYVRPYLGSAGQRTHSPLTVTFTCTGSQCTGGPRGLSQVLTKFATGSYRYTRKESDSSEHGPMRYTRTITLVVTGAQATYASADTGAFAGSPSSGSYADHPPQGFTLTGPATFG